MQQVDLSALTLEQIVHYVHQLSPAILQERINHLNPEQIAATISALEESKDKEWKEKLKAAIRGIIEYPKIEAVGKALTMPQAREIIEGEWILQKGEAWKLSPLLVGMSHEVFTQFLRSATPSHIQIFKQEAIGEPLLHHLTVLIHEIVNQMAYHIELIKKLEESIERFDLKEISKEELSRMMLGIHNSREYYEETLEKINKMLSLAWNSSRVDLIDKLSQTKEGCQKFLVQVIGHPKTTGSAPTGLYAQMQNKLNLVFGDPDNPQDIEALKNDEPVLEALVKFSIWYLRDYWEAGLLPHIKDPLVFNQIEEMGNTERGIQLRNELLNQVQQNLFRIGLRTVEDLKKAGIFSKKILQEYIGDHQYLMAP